MFDAGSGAGPRASLTVQRIRTAWLLTVPMLLVLLGVAGWPLARTMWLGLTDANLSRIEDWNFVGLENYFGEFGLLTDPEWWNAVWNTLVFVTVSVGLETVFGLMVALMLHHPSRVRTLLRATMLIPWAIPTVVSAKLWSWMLHDQYGIINHYLQLLGLMSVTAPIAWTADPDLALFSVVIVDVWKTTPFMALLILAALQLVPQDCYEAAKVDGVPPLRVFFRITLPLIMPGIVVAMIFRTLDAMRIFDLVYVMTSNSRDTKVMSVYVREQMIDFQQVGMGSTAATALFFIIALITAIYLVAARSRMREVA